MTSMLLEPPDVVDVDQAAAGESDGVSSGVSEDAPYGINPRTGKPYKRDPEWRAKLADTLARGRATQARQKPPPRTRAKTSKPGTSRAAGAGSVDYRPAVAAIVQIPMAVTAVLAKVTGKPAFALDTATLKLHGPTIAAAGHDWAVQDARVAAILDHALAISPAAVFIGAALPVVLQLAANHGAIEPMPDMGILGPEDLLNAAFGAAPQPT